MGYMLNPIFQFIMADVSIIVFIYLQTNNSIKWDTQINYNILIIMIKIMLW